MCDYAGSKPGPQHQGAYNLLKFPTYFVTGLSEEQRLFSARLNLRALFYVAVLSAQLDMQELAHVALARLAYCLLAGDRLTDSVVYDSCSRKARSWHKPRGRVHWPTLPSRNRCPRSCLTS